MDGDSFNVAVIVIVIAVWLLVDGYSKRVRRQVRRMRRQGDESEVKERGDVLDAHALSVSDD